MGNLTKWLRSTWNTMNNISQQYNDVRQDTRSGGLHSSMDDIDAIPNLTDEEKVKQKQQLARNYALATTVGLSLGSPFTKIGGDLLYNLGISSAINTPLILSDPNSQNKGQEIAIEMGANLAAGAVGKGLSKWSEVRAFKKDLAKAYGLNSPSQLKNSEELKQSLDRIRDMRWSSYVMATDQIPVL